MIEEVEVSLKPVKSITEGHLPTIIKWKGHNMIRVHSIRATVKEILNVSKSLDAIKIGIIGNPHTGKSTLAELLAHLIHKMSEKEPLPIPFAIKKFTKDDLLNFEATLKDLKPNNYILIFDDVSFLGASASKKQIEVVKQAMTEIRHLQGGEDVKIIAILNYHYTLGLDKYLRQAEFRYFTSIGSSELDNMEKIVGSKYMPKIREFQKIYTKAISLKKFTFRIGTKGHFTYGYREPFIPLLFYNNDSLRYVVSPTREWVDPICSKCAEAEGSGEFESLETTEKFLENFAIKFGADTSDIAIKLALFENGMNVYSPLITQAKRYLARALESKLFSLEQIATIRGFSITRTRLRKKLDDFIT